MLANVYPRTHHISASKCVECREYLDVSVIDEVPPDSICNICNENEHKESREAPESNPLLGVWDDDDEEEDEDLWEEEEDEDDDSSAY